MSRDRLFAWLFMIMTIASNVSSWIIIDQKDDAVKQLQSDARVYKNEALQNHTLYEGARKDVAKLERDLVEVKRNLQESAERERAARREVLRASRSRGAVPSKSYAGTSSFGGGLHDITMYCPTGNATASGKIPRRGFVATLSRSIPFGTRISIEGLGVYVVEDRIGSGSEFDIFTPRCSEAKTFGRKHRRVTILN